jgi:hypothetical protein
LCSNLLAILPPLLILNVSALVVQDLAAHVQVGIVNHLLARLLEWSEANGDGAIVRISKEVSAVVTVSAAFAAPPKARSERKRVAPKRSRAS